MIQIVKFYLIFTCLTINIVLFLKSTSLIAETKRIELNLFLVIFLLSNDIMMEVVIQDQQQKEVEHTTEESFSPDLAASNRTTQSSSLAISSVNSGSAIGEEFVLQKLFERGQAYASIIKEIFLYLDPKTLKYWKLTCSQWKVFIDKEIWGGASARKVLDSRLTSNWKDEYFVKVSKINPGHRTSEFDCDKDVMVFCGDGGLASVYSSSTHEKLYTFTFPRVNYVSIGDDFISLDFSNQLIIIKKFTGQIEYQGQHASMKSWWRMIGNVVVTSNDSGKIHILSKDPETMKWTKQEQKSNIKLDSHWGLCGEEDYVLIADKEEIHLWDWKNGRHTDKRVKCERAHQVEFITPFVFAHCGTPGQHIMKIFNIFTGDLVRQNIIDSPFKMHVGHKFLSIVTTFSQQSVSVFDLRELTNEELENDQLWRRVFWARHSNSEYSYADGASIKSKMVVISVGGRTVEIYDFWPDREYEVTEDTDSDESEDDDEDHSEETDESD